MHRRLDVDTIEYLLGDSIIGVWEKVEPIVEGMRTQYNMPELYKWFEYLYKEIQKREQRIQQT